MDRVKKIISQTFKLKPEDITMDLSSETVELWDSLGQLTLISAIEKEFEIVLETEEIFEIITIGDIYKILKRKNVLTEEESET